MKNSRRTFFKQGLAGALALGSASLPVSAAAMTDGVGKAKAKRVVLISLDGICVEGFLKARTPNLDEVSYLEQDAYVPNYEKAFSFLKANEGNPTLVFLYSVHTDHAGHKHKWMSPEYIKSIEEADVEIGKFLEKMKRDGLYKDTHFMFLTDHGGIEYGHGGVSTNEMIVPWGITGPGIRKGFKITEPNNTVNTAATILRLFDVEKPLPWTGEVLSSIFK